MMTPLQRERLDGAVKALDAAGGLSIPIRLRAAVESGDRAKVHDVLMQARIWASDVQSFMRPAEIADKAKARDAIGLLWAVMEDEDR